MHAFFFIDRSEHITKVTGPTQAALERRKAATYKSFILILVFNDVKNKLKAGRISSLVCFNLHMSR